MSTGTVRLKAVSLWIASLLILGGCGGSDMQVAEPQSGGEAAVPSVYRLRPGDTIRVRILTDEDRTYTTPVTPAGTVVAPTGEEVPAAGSSVAELKSSLEEALKHELLDPSVSIDLVDIANQYVFVLGAVERPDRMDFKGGLTVSMVLAQAGGVMTSAKSSSVMIIRSYGFGEPTAMKVDVSKVLSGRDPSEDVALYPNDIVYVPKSVIGKVGDFADLFFEGIAPAQLFYLRGYQMLNPEGEIIIW